MFDKKTINNLFLIALFLVYSAVTIVIMFHHEVWIDEAQAWLVVRNLSLLGIIKQIQVEGHPFLWYFILLPFAKAGLGVIWMQTIAVVAMIFSATLLLWKSPFDNFTKAAIALSPCYIYWLPDVARNYCLVAPLIFLLAIYWQKQKEHPYIFSMILILLANTHLLMFVFCFFVFIALVFESIKDFIKSKNVQTLFPVILQALAFFGIYLFFYLLNHSNISNVAKNYNILDNIIHFILCFGFFSFLKPNLYLYYFACLVSWTLLISLPILLFKNDKRIFFAALFGILFQFYIYIFVIYVIPERVGLTLLILIFAFWVVSYSEDLKKSLLYKITKISFFLFFALSIPITINLAKGDYFNNFSASKETAEFIKKNLSKETAFTGVGFISAVSAYCPDVKFYSPAIDGYYSFYPYVDEKKQPYTYKMSKEELQTHNIKYIVSHKALNDDDLMQIYAPNPKKFYYSDKYYIYKYNNK